MIKKMIRIEKAQRPTLDETFLDTYSRTQNIHRMWRKRNGIWVLADEAFVYDWDLSKKQEVAEDLLSERYISYVALDGNKVVGFIGLLSHLFDECMVLDYMHIDQRYRRKGIGSSLFQKACCIAFSYGASCLYIPACPAEETIAFYRAMGAQVSEDVIKEMVREEPSDLQLRKML